MARLDAARRWFWILTLSHLVVYVVVAMLTQPNAPLDTIEMQHWGRNPAWGYYKHPPLPGWLAEVGHRLGGDSGWLIHLFGQLLMVACFWSVWRLAGEVLPPSRALLSVLMLEAIHYYNYTSLEFNNNLCLVGFAALGTVALFQALRGGGKLIWLAAGAAWGLACLSKYAAGFALLPLLLWTFYDREVRGVWRTPGPYLALAACLLILGPHLAWAARHDWITIEYALDRSADDSSPWDHLVNPLRFLLDQLWATMFMLLTIVPLLLPRRREPSVAQRFLVVAGLGPLLTVLLVAAATGARLRSMWGMPLFTFAAPALLVWFAPRPGWWRVRRALRVGLIWAAGWLIAVVGRNVVGPYVDHTPARVHFPGPALAARAEALWAEHADGPLPIAAGDWWPAGNIGFYAAARPEVYTDTDPRKAPWCSDDELNRRGGVLVWEPSPDNPAPPPDWPSRFPRLTAVQRIELPPQTGAAVPPARIGLALVPPGLAERVQGTGNGMAPTGP